MGGPADEHRRIAGAFTATVEGTAPTAWDDPAPVEGWTARDVVRHLVEWFPAFLQGSAGITLPPGPSVDDDPAGAWHELERGVRALLDDPATATRVLTNRHLGDVPLDRAVSRFFTADVFMHTWDLARATGQDDTLDPDHVQRMAAATGSMPEEVLRAGGMFGQAVEVPDHADDQTKLLAYLGRRV